jgi:3-oxoacyl-[acyl-carrier protein] reductase
VGAGGGIGQALVAALLASGCRVAALDLPGPLAAARWPDTVWRVPVDATEPASVDAAFGTVAGPLDGFVHLAGFAPARRPAAEIAPEAWREVLAGNLDGAQHCLRATTPLLLRAPAASVVLLSSGLALKPAPGYAAYAAAKAGLLALMRVAAAELAPGVRVNAVAPSAVDTPFLAGGTGRPPREASFDRTAYAASVPLGRLARPDDVVGPILFLLGPASAYMTGQTLHVNGGLLMP